MALTTKQKRLASEIREISAIADMDHWDNEKYPAPLRTTFLELTKNKLIRSEVVLKYAVIDELLAVLVCHEYFPKPRRGQSFRRLWKERRFRIFVHYILDEMYLLAKLRTVHAIKAIPKGVRTNIERINALRNALTHSLFPENRRQYISNKKVIYRGSDIFTREGLTKFEEDFDLVHTYLMGRVEG